MTSASQPPVNDAEDWGGENYRQARRCLAEGRFAEALSLFADCARRDPHFKTFEMLGECLPEFAHPAEAVQPLAAACALNRGARPRVLLARALSTPTAANGARPIASRARTPRTTTPCSSRAWLGGRARHQRRDAGWHRAAVRALMCVLVGLLLLGCAVVNASCNDLPFADRGDHHGGS